VPVQPGGDGAELREPGGELILGGLGSWRAAEQHAVAPGERRLAHDLKDLAAAAGRDHARQERRRLLPQGLHPGQLGVDLGRRAAARAVDAQHGRVRGVRLDTERPVLGQRVLMQAAVRGDAVTADRQAGHRGHILKAGRIHPVDDLRPGAAHDSPA